MKAAGPLLLWGLVAFPMALAQSPQDPTIVGYVTRAASGSDFDVNGLRVLCNEQTVTLVQIDEEKAEKIQGCPRHAPYFGEPVNLLSVVRRKNQAFEAKRIGFPLTEEGPVTGSAIIEACKEPVRGAPQSSELLLRADGYWIRIGRQTHIKFIPPLSTLADVKPGDWMEYEGAKKTDGEVTAVSAKIGRNVPSKSEKNLKEEYDPVVTANAKLAYSKGPPEEELDPQNIPLFSDREMQGRVIAIGEKLVPAFQRDLPDSDPAKIHFRFHVIGANRPREPVALPNGIVLIPHQVVERMQNDAQLAAVLAYGIAWALEREEFRLRPTKERVGLAALNALWTTALFPSIVIEGQLSFIAEAKEQSTRVSLELLHDAGYDIDQAPIAWWLLGSKQPRPVAKIDLPERAAYLYRILGETRYSPAAKAVQAD